MKWSKIKKQFENLLADNVKSRISFHKTIYRKSHDSWLGEFFINLDNETIFKISDGEGEELYTNNLAYEAVGQMIKYVNMSFDDIINSDNEYIISFSLLDKRFGKRKLKNFKPTNNSLVKLLYSARMKCENYDFKKL